MALRPKMLRYAGRLQKIDGKSGRIEEEQGRSYRKLRMRRRGSKTT